MTLRVHIRTDADAERFASAMAKAYEDAREAREDVLSQRFLGHYRDVETERGSSFDGANLFVRDRFVSDVVEALEAKAQEYLRLDASVFGYEADRLEDMAQDLEDRTENGTRLEVLKCGSVEL